MNKIKLYSILAAICFILFVGILGIFMYERTVYEKDRTEYDMAVKEYEAAKAVAFDSIVSVWTANNDTTLRKIRKITSVPVYLPIEQRRKTGKWVCETHSYREGKMICEPETKLVPTGDYYLSHRRQDTLWTEGYVSREDWVAKARNFAAKESAGMYPGLKYDGHDRHFFISKDLAVGLCIMLIFVIVGFIYFVGGAVHNYCGERSIMGIVAGYFCFVVCVIAYSWLIDVCM